MMYKSFPDTMTAAVDCGLPSVISSRPEPWMLLHMVCRSHAKLKVNFDMFSYEGNGCCREHK